MITTKISYTIIFKSLKYVCYKKKLYKNTGKLKGIRYSISNYPVDNYILDDY